MKTKTEFLDRFSVKPVEIVVGGEKIHVRPIPMGEGVEIREWLKGYPGKDAAIFFVRAVCDPDGNRLFTDEDAIGLHEIVPAGVANDVVVEVTRLSHGETLLGKAHSPTSQSSNSS